MSTQLVEQAKRRSVPAHQEHRRPKWIGTADQCYSCVGYYYTNVAMSTSVEYLPYRLRMSSELPPFGSWLDEQIDLKGWSPSDLARAVNTSTANVTRWRKKGVIPDPDSCNNIALALGIVPEIVLYHARHLDKLPIPLSRYEQQQQLREMQEHLRNMERVAVGDEVAVRFYGRVPADTVRWVSSEQHADVDYIPEQWTRTYAPVDLFLVEASGDCLQSRGIIDGTRVLLKRALGIEPKNDTIVLIRFGGEYTLKRWFRDGDWIDLQDGSGRTIHRFSIMEEFEVVGEYVAHWYFPQD